MSLNAKLQCTISVGSGLWNRSFTSHFTHTLLNTLEAVPLLSTDCDFKERKLRFFFNRTKWAMCLYWFFSCSLASDPEYHYNPDPHSSPHIQISEWSCWVSRHWSCRKYHILFFFIGSHGKWFKMFNLDIINIWIPTIAVAVPYT